MDYERLMETIATEESLTYTYENNNGLALHGVMSIVSTTMFGDTIEILGFDNIRIEIPFGSVDTIEYFDNNIVITMGSDRMILYLDRMMKIY